MPRSFRVAVAVAFWVAIRDRHPLRRRKPVHGAGFRGPVQRPTRWWFRRTSSERPSACAGKAGEAGLADGGAWMPRPFWVVLWDPVWDPLWRPIRTGSPSAAENPHTIGRSDVRSSARQGCGLRRRSERGRVLMPGTSASVDLRVPWIDGHMDDRRSDPTRARRCGDDPGLPLRADLDRRGPPAEVASDATGAA
jgi:hypothetical protein